MIKYLILFLFSALTAEAGNFSPETHWDVWVSSIHSYSSRENLDMIRKQSEYLLRDRKDFELRQTGFITQDNGLPDIENASPAIIAQWIDNDITQGRMLSYSRWLGAKTVLAYRKVYLHFLVAKGILDPGLGPKFAFVHLKKALEEKHGPREAAVAELEKNLSDLKALWTAFKAHEIEISKPGKREKRKVPGTKSIVKSIIHYISGIPEDDRGQTRIKNDWRLTIRNFVENFEKGLTFWTPFAKHSSIHVLTYEHNWDEMQRRLYHPIYFLNDRACDLALAPEELLKLTQ